MQKKQTSNNVDQFSEQKHKEAKERAAELQMQREHIIQRNNLSVQLMHDSKQQQQAKQDQKTALRLHVATMEKKRSKKQIANIQELNEQPIIAQPIDLPPYHNFKEYVATVVLLILFSTYFHMGIKPKPIEKPPVMQQHVPRASNNKQRRTKINPMTSHVQLKMEQKRAMLEQEASAIITRERYQKVKDMLAKPIAHTAGDIERGFETNFLH